MMVVCGSLRMGECMSLGFAGGKAGRVQAPRAGLIGSMAGWKKEVPYSDSLEKVGSREE